MSLGMSWNSKGLWPSTLVVCTPWTHALVFLAVYEGETIRSYNFLWTDNFLWTGQAWLCWPQTQST